MRLRLALVLLAACSKSPPEPPGAVVTDSGASPAASRVVDAAPRPAEAGWDLDPRDPARDYVRRYIKATSRYEKKTDCVIVGKSTEKGGQRAVEVRETPTCGGANTVRDVFYVDLAADRLALDDPATRAPLKKWPDGSPPDAPAAPVQSIGSMRDWASPMVAVLERLKLAPVGVQLYGRGTYVLLGLSGWHSPIARDAKVDEMRLAGQKLCVANQDRDFALKEVASDTVWLRFKCPAGTWTWDLRH
jgi:hypothetical protein